MLALENGKYVKHQEEQIANDSVISYEERVVALIRQQYSFNEELAIQRQRDTKPEEFQRYFTYCEDCKKRAKSL